MSFVMMLTAFLAASLPAAAQDQPADRFEQYVQHLSPEKVYLHTDREVYNIGDTLWFRGYLENVAPHAAYAPCNYLYVELFSDMWERNFQKRQEATRMRLRVKVKRGEDGTFSGYLPLKQDLNSGVATLRAYSYWMLNGNPAYLFTKDIELRNPMKDAFVSDLMIAEYSDQRIYDELGIRNPYRKEIFKSSSKRETDVDLQLLPESGRYLPGKPAVLAVKAVNQDGLGVRVEGRIVADGNHVLAGFETNDLGMGRATVTVPEGTSRLRAEAETAVENFRFEADVPLPEAAGVVIGVRPDEAGISIHVSDAGLALPDSTWLVIYDRDGFVLQSDYAESRNGKRVEYKDLKPGINVVAVIGQGGAVYAERPFFVFPDGPVASSMTLSTTNPGQREKVTATLQLRDAAGKPLSGSFSLAVTDEDFAPASGTGHSIVSWMLLGSELKGLVEQPQRYFDERVPLKQRIAEADLLLLTQGWRYYDLPAILRNQNEKPRFGKEYTQSLSGFVNGVLGKSKSATLCFAAPSIGYSQIADLDSTAYFALNGLDFPDSTQFVVGAQGNGKMFKKWYTPVLYPDYFAAGLQPVHYLAYAGYDEEYADLARRSYAITDGSLVYTLAPARIEAPRSYNLSPYPYDNFKPHQLRTEKELKPYADMDLVSYIYETCPQIWRNPENEMDRRMNVFDGTVNADGTYWLVTVNLYLNGMPANWQDLGGIYVSDVQAFAIITGVDAAKYDRSLSYPGFRHAPPAVLVSARYPARSASNVTGGRPLGWQRPARFYAPKYENSAAKRRFEPMRPTLHWDPNVEFVDGQATVSFYSSDHVAPWRIVLEGVSDTNRPISVQTLIPNGE